MIIRDVEALRTLAAKLEPGRKDSAIVNDMFEAADGWRDLAERLIRNTGRTDFPGRMQQEVELFARLQAFYREALLTNPDYSSIMQAGERVIAEGKKRRLDPDGYLGSLKIIRQTFAFLESGFGLTLVRELLTEAEYESGRISVRLDLPTEYDSSCQLKQLSDPARAFALEDLLFMGGRSVSLALPQGQEITTEADVQAWFTTVADVLRQYGSDVIADRPGAFDRLGEAAAERERLYIEECERLYGAGTSNGSGAG